MEEITYVRVRPPACAVRHPEHNELVVPNPAQPYRSDDPLVIAYPWQFASDEQIASDRAAADSVSSVPIEQATARPGEKRNTRRK